MVFHPSLSRDRTNNSIQFVHRQSNIIESYTFVVYDAKYEQYSTDSFFPSWILVKNILWLQLLLFNRLVYVSVDDRLFVNKPICTYIIGKFCFQIYGQLVNRPTIELKCTYSFFVAYWNIKAYL